MPENIKELSLLQAAAELSKTMGRGLLDEKGFRLSDDDDEGPETDSTPPVETDSEDVGSDENPTTDQEGDEDEIADDDAEASDSDEAEAAPTIEPPKSFNSEEQAEFRNLPPVMQETLVRRESERDRAVLQRMNQIAEERKLIEPIAQRLQQEQQNFSQAIQTVLQLGIPDAKEFDGMDESAWVRLSNENPTEFVQKKARFEALQGRIGRIANQAQQVQQAQAHQFLQRHGQLVQDQTQKLIQELPELSDPAKVGPLVESVRGELSRYGFSDQEIAMLADSRQFKVMARLVELEGREKTRQSALAKKSSSPAPRVLTGNSATNREQNKNVKRKEAMDRLSKTGDIWDAVRAMTV